MKIIVVTVFEKSAQNAFKTLHMRNWQQGAIFKVTFFCYVSQAIKVFIVFIFVVLIITIVIAIAIAKILIDASDNDDDD